MNWTFRNQVGKRGKMAVKQIYTNDDDNNSGSEDSDDDMTMMVNKWQPISSVE